MERLYPEVAWRLIAVSPAGESLGTASWRALAPDLRVCVTLVRFEHRMSAARLAGRTANIVTGGRSVSTRAGHRHLTFCERGVSAFASTAVRLALLFRDRGSLHRTVTSRRDDHRPVASVFVITREHHLASRSILAGSTPPSARCDVSPVSASGSGGITPLSPTGADPWIQPLSVVLASASRGPDACAEHLVVAPAWPAVRRYRRPARQRVSPGPSQRLRASPAAFASREGGCFTSR